MGKRTGRALALVLTLGALYLLFQLLRFSGGELETERAQEYIADDTLSLDGFVIRNEILIRNPGGGALRYLLEDGDRVSKNGAVAEIYSDSAQVSDSQRLTALETGIALLRETQKKQQGEVAPDLPALEAQIFSQYLSALRNMTGKKLPQASESLEQVLMLMNRKQIISGEAQNFEKRIGEMERQAASLRSSIRSSGKILADASGYFVRQADGQESAVNYEKATELTVETLAAAKQASQPLSGDVAGKIVREYEWYIAAEIPRGELYWLREGASMRLSLPASGISKLPVRLVALNPDNRTGNAVGVFLCTYMNSQLAAVRSQPVLLLRESYSGLRIPRRAVRVLDGKQGVYITKGGIARFKEITILYSASDYFIIRQGEQVALYDEIITKGKGLYDGKMVG